MRFVLTLLIPIIVILTVVCALEVTFGSESKQIDFSEVSHPAIAECVRESVWEYRQAIRNQYSTVIYYHEELLVYASLVCSEIW